MYSAEILCKDSRHFFPLFFFVYCFQFAKVCIKYPHLDMPTEVICTSPFVRLTENQLCFLPPSVSMTLS